MFQSLLKKLGKGTLTKREGRKLAKWLRSKRSDRYFSEWYDREVSRADSGLSPRLTPERHEALKRRLLQQMGTLSKEESNFRKPGQRTSSVYYKWAAAASLLFLVGLGLFFFISRPNENLLTQEEPAIEWVEKSNPAGKKTLIHLPDGSKVYLNSESTLRFAKQFISNRQVYLEGEAYFEVAKDSIHAFTVQTDSILTRVLGTAFNIRSFPDEEIVSVALASGSIETHIQGQDQKEILVPGQGLAVSKGEERTTRIFDADLHAIRYWTEGVLHFDQISFSKLIRILERWYGVEIQVRGEVPQGSGFTGTFKNQENLINVLDAIQFSEPFQYQSKDKKVIITF